jgi:hypothetical protein
MNTVNRQQPFPLGTPHVAADRAPSLRVRAGGWRLAAVVAFISIMAACASGPPTYVEPPVSTGSAKVRVVNMRPYAYYADIAIFDSASCFDKADLGMTGGNSKDGVRIGMLDDKQPSASSIERHVRAGEALVIGPRAVFPTASVSDILHALTPDLQEKNRAKQAGVCRLPSFVPKLDEQYEVLVDLTPAHCSVKPYRLVELDGAVQREEVPAQPSQISTYEFDMKCFK